MKFDIPDGLSFTSEGDSHLALVSLISSMSALHLMNKGNLCSDQRC